MQNLLFACLLLLSIAASSQITVQMKLADSTSSLFKIIEEKVY